MNNPIVVVDYDPQWPEVFATIHDALAEALADVPVVGIEHVGSTSVPGLAAKPIIDVDVIVHRQSVSRAIDALQSAGYENHLGLRDVLRSDAGLRDEYAAVKLQMAGATTDIDVYLDGKTAVVRRILQRAGLSATELDEIEGINRL